MGCEGDAVMGARRSWPFMFALSLLTRVSLRASNEMSAEEFFSINTFTDSPSKTKFEESVESFFKSESDWRSFKQETGIFEQMEQEEEFFFQGYEQNADNKMKKLTGKRVDAEEETVSKGSRYCNCHDVYCSCCTSVRIWGKKTFKGCMEMEYVARDFAIFMTLSINGHVIITRVVSGRNPLPFCARTPYVPLVSFCIRLYDIHHNPAGLSLCARLEVTSMRTILFSVSFDCIKIDNHKMSFLMPPNATTFGVVGLHLGETDPYLSYQDWTKLHFPLPDVTSTLAPPTATPPSTRKHLLPWFLKR